jgi:hypothetical protein
VNIYAFYVEVQLILDDAVMFAIALYVKAKVIICAGKKIYAFLLPLCKTC